MANEWILDVLADLRSFARKNSLSALASQLDDAALVAAAEIASKNDEDGPGGSGSVLPRTRQEA